MKADVVAYCRREMLFSEGDRVLCAVSGGADSTAMLLCLHALRETLGISIRAAHFNHALRGAESDRDEAFVRDLCRRLEIPLTVDRADAAAYAAAHRLSIETAARELRYRFLHSLPCDKLATAHTSDDNVETVLLHLLRGSGLRGLCGIPPKNGKLVRPLLCVTHVQVMHYLRAEGQTWVEDSTNVLPTCRRNRLRSTVVPLLRDENPSLSPNITEMTSLLRQEDAFLDDLARKLLQSCANCDDGSWRIAELLQAPAVLRRRALRLITEHYLPQDISRVHIDALESLLSAESPSARCRLPQGLVAERRYDRLVLHFSDTQALAPTPLVPDGITELPAIGLRVVCKFTKNYKKSANTPFHFAVRYDMIEQVPLLARSRQIGDVLFLRSGHRKSLKKLLIDCKIPRYERDRLVVIDADGAVVGVLGVGINHAYSAVAGQPALIIFSEKEEM